MAVKVGLLRTLRGFARCCREEGMKSAKGSGPARLERARVVATALRIARQGKFEDITMTRVARELGVTPMALYRHVGNKDELLRHVVEAVNAQIELPFAGSGAWMDLFLVAVRRVNDRYAEYPGLAAYVLSTSPVPTTLGGARIAEWFLEHYFTAGLSPERAALAYATFREFFLAGLIQTQRDRRPILPEPEGSTELNEMFMHMASITPDDRFEFAFRVFSEWLESQVVQDAPSG